METTLKKEVIDFFLSELEIDTISTLDLSYEEFIYMTNSEGEYAVKYKNVLYTVTEEFAASDYGDRVDTEYLVYPADKDDFIQYVLQWGSEIDKEVIKQQLN